MKTAIVLRRTGGDVPMQDGRDVWWHELVADESDDPASCPCEPMDSEDLLYLLYTSGTTAKPKGIVHTTGGYLVGAATTHHYIFDVKPDSVYWCAADVGWVTGHSYIVYGPLCNGTTGVMYEGAPDFPDQDRWWAIVERYGVDILYTAPTAIRTPHEVGAGARAEARPLVDPPARLGRRADQPGGLDLVPRARSAAAACPVVDTWWQTETGMILITPLPGVTTLKPGSATKPFPGVDAAVYDEQGNEVGPGGGGYLVLRGPWPAMLRGIYNDHDRYVETYWSKYPDVYFAGDGARIDEDGDFWLIGRVDDVMNVSGPPDLDDRGRERARRPPRGRRGGGLRPRADATTGPGDRRVRDAQGRRGGLGREARGAAQPRGEEDRPDREAGEHRLHAGAAEDAQRQDHAPAPARRGREPRRSATRRRSPTRRSSTRSATARPPRAPEE